MDTYPQQELFLWQVGDFEVLDRRQKMESHDADLFRVEELRCEGGDTADNHVGVADRLDLVDTVLLDDLIEEGVQLVQKLYHLEN